MILLRHVVCLSNLWTWLTILTILGSKKLFICWNCKSCVAQHIQRCCWYFREWFAVSLDKCWTKVLISMFWSRSAFIVLIVVLGLFAVGPFFKYSWSASMRFLADNSIYCSVFLEGGTIYLEVEQFNASITCIDSFLFAKFWISNIITLFLGPIIIFTCLFSST